MCKFRTAQEFYDWCVERGACPEGLKAIKGKTAAKWWATTRRGDWMWWLWRFGVWRLTNAQRAEYERASAAAWDEYMHTAVDRGDCESRIARAELKYDRARADAIRQIVGNPFKEASRVR